MTNESFRVGIGCSDAFLSPKKPQASSGYALMDYHLLVIDSSALCGFLGAENRHELCNYPVSVTDNFITHHGFTFLTSPLLIESMVLICSYK